MMNTVKAWTQAFWGWLAGLSRVRIPRARSLDELEDRSPPVWMAVHVKPMGELQPRRPMPLMVCPGRHRFALGESHPVDASGVVGATVGCPECNWSATVELEGWGS